MIEKVNLTEKKVLWWNNDTCESECKSHYICEKDYIWNPRTCSCKNEKCLASIIDDSAITCDKMTQSYNQEIKPISKNFN